jgi:predicted TIM-barrel fold metal-dependent hydrolase
VTIDVHSHWIPPVIAQALRARSAPPRLIPGDRDKELLDLGFAKLPQEVGFELLDQRLAEMDANGISVAILSLSPVYGVDALPLEEALPLCRAYNNAVSEACSMFPDRLRGFAVLPFVDFDAAFEEFKRARRLPGMIGAVLPGDGFVSKKRASRFRRFFAEAEANRGAFLIHYGTVGAEPDPFSGDRSDNAAMRIGTLDMQGKLSAAMVTLGFTDFLDDFPSVAVLTHNLGGNLALEVERLDHRHIFDEVAGQLPSERLRNLPILLDCNSFGPRAIELAVEVFGSSKLVFGSDGSNFGSRWTHDAIAKARIPEEARDAILEHNAARLLELAAIPKTLKSAVG